MFWRSGTPLLPTDGRCLPRPDDRRRRTRGLARHSLRRCEDLAPRRVRVGFGTGVVRAGAGPEGEETRPAQCEEGVREVRRLQASAQPERVEARSRTRHHGREQRQVVAGDARGRLRRSADDGLTRGGVKVEDLGAAAAVCGVPRSLPGGAWVCSCRMVLSQWAIPPFGARPGGPRELPTSKGRLAFAQLVFTSFRGVQYVGTGTRRRRENGRNFVGQTPYPRGPNAVSSSIFLSPSGRRQSMRARREEKAPPGGRNPEEAARARIRRR